MACGICPHYLTQPAWVEAHQEPAVRGGRQTAEDGGADFRVGYQVPSVEVRFEDLHITTSVYAAAGTNQPSTLGRSVMLVGPGFPPL